MQIVNVFTPPLRLGVNLFFSLLLFVVFLQPELIKKLIKKTMNHFHKNVKLLFFIATVSLMVSACGEKENEPQTTPTPAAESAFDSNGATKSAFSISDTKSVHFSKGNLQYNAASSKWRFAENQYDYVGDGNINASSSYDGWVDLFLWGTSGWNNYQPWDTELNPYHVGGSSTNDLTGEYANADWGVFNAISNGGNTARKWRTLTAEEWAYLLGNNTKRNGKWATAVVNDHFGLIVLPDSFTMPDSITLTAGAARNTYTGEPSNRYTLAQWKKLELAGAVFLPAAGRRVVDGTELRVNFAGSEGVYWSTTHAPDDYYGNSACSVDFMKSYLNVEGTAYRYHGVSVRLVKD